MLVHCSQGVSRSATIAIGYCIWKLNKDFDVIFEYVKKIRTVVSPNMGFQCASPPYSVNDVLLAARQCTAVSSDTASCVPHVLPTFFLGTHYMAEVHFAGLNYCNGKNAASLV